MARDIRFDQRMSEAEGLMWRLEKDPHLSSTFANLTILDRAPDTDRLRRRLAHAALVVPRLRQRVLPAPGNSGPPMWVEDAHFDIDYHVRHVALPRPGSMRRLQELAGLLANDPFDRARPLWQFVVVDGLPRGRSALIQKLHHTIADGEGSVRMSLQFLDLERDAPDPEPPDPETLVVGPVPTEPNALEALRDFLAGSIQLPLGLARQFRDLALDPAQLQGTGVATADGVRSIIGQLMETDGARSPLWTSRSLGRRLEVLRAPFEETKAAAERLGGTLNTAFLTAAAHGAGAYHREAGLPVEDLRASMAISSRTAASGANAFSLARLLVPTGEMEIAERFGRIQAETEAARDGTSSAQLETIATLASALPTSVVTRLARHQAQTVDFATSNVRGAPVPVFLAGSQVVANHPIGPLAGVAFNLTLLSYHGSLDMGLHVDTAAIAEPDRLRKHIERAFATLASA